MIEKIITGILAALEEEFGDTYSFYTEEIEQGLEKPCFFIFCLNLSMNLFRGGRYQNKNQFSIRYLSGSPEPMKDCGKVAERLFHCLELITVDGDLLRGSGAKAVIDGGSLTYTVNFDYFSYIPNTETKMELLENSNTQVKE